MTQELKKVRQRTDITMKLRLTSDGVAIAWADVHDLRICVYSDAQKSYSGKCLASPDPKDPFTLVAVFPAEMQNYKGPHRVVCSCEFQGGQGTYDAPAFEIVGTSAEVLPGMTTEQENAAIGIDLHVEEISSTIIAAAINSAIVATIESQRQVEDAKRQMAEVVNACNSAVDKSIAASDTAINSAQTADTSSAAANDAAALAREKANMAEQAYQAAMGATVVATDAADTANGAAAEATKAKTDAETATREATAARDAATDAANNANEQASAAFEAASNAHQVAAGAKATAEAAAKKAIEAAGTATTAATHAETKGQEAKQTAEAAATTANAASAAAQERIDQLAAYEADLAEQKRLNAVLVAENNALKALVDNGGHHKAMSYDAEEGFSVCGRPCILTGHGTPSADTIPDQKGIPAFIGQEYINLDASASGKYYATGTNSVGDWKNA